MRSIAERRKKRLRMRRIALLISACVAVIILACSLPTQVQRISTAPGCLQAGFNAPVGGGTLTELKNLGWQVIRLDVQQTDSDTANYMVYEVMIAQLRPLVIVRDAAQIRAMGVPDIDYELRNEPDLEGPSPADYRQLMIAAARATQDIGARLYVGAVSNLNDRGFAYLHAIRPFPEGVRVSVHRYGDGTFDDPHSGFANRENEVRWLQAAIGDLPFAVTEFGYPDGDMSEEEAARRIRVEFEFWAGKADFACLYQLNDGPRNFAIDKFGIRRIDGSWKPSAYVLR
jgi:hypothetical protein